MNPTRGGPLPGLPTDRLWGAYLLISAAALLFPHREAGWLVLLTLHVAAGTALLVSRPLTEAADGWALRARAALDWLPLLLIPALYTELAPLNRAVHDGRYFDSWIIAAERALFGGMPSSEWAAAVPRLWLSEPLHAAYLSYYFIIFVPPFVLYLRGRTEAFRYAVFSLLLTFFAHYLFFIYLPVQGPRYLFPAPQGELASGWFYQLAHRVLEAGSAQGAAFPSSHVGVSVAQTIITWQLLRSLVVPTALLTVGLALGAVYGGFHYATDALAGAVLGIACMAAAPTLYARLGARAGKGTAPPAIHAADKRRDIP